MVYSCHAIKFQDIELIHCTQWMQGISDRGVSYKAKHDPYSKMLIQSISGNKKLYRVPKDKTVLIIDSTAHFIGEPS